MTQSQWEYFEEFKLRFQTQVEKIKTELGTSIIPLQEEARKLHNVPDYPVENPVVYNTDLDKITSESQIKLILIGDNPGKEEQLNINKKYLCGLSGKIAEGFFKKNTELQIDFRQNVIILNKTPIHTAKTNELNFLSNNSPSIKKIIKESQIFMAREIVALQKNFDIPVWIVGYGEIKPNKIFSEFQKEFLSLYKQDEFKNYFEKLFVFQHFSMNRFSIDLNEFIKNHSELSSKTLIEQIEAVGLYHKNEIFNLK